MDKRGLTPGAGALPLPLDAFLGRERDLARVCALLRTPTIRLVTLTGPAGTGKTRLALHAGHAIASHFPDGVVLVPLAPVTHPAHLLPALAQALGVPEEARPLVEQIQATLHSRCLLLILDSLEHLLSAAPLLPDLLRTCAGLSLLVTSRATLRVSGEHVVPVEPLPVPDLTRRTHPAALRKNPAVRLFLVRARAAWAEFVATDEEVQAIAQVCRRLDGLPLAIELAAAQVPVLPPVAMLARLDRRLPLLGSGPADVPDRLRTLRDAIAWSYDLLPPDRQALFRRLAVCSGGFSLELATRLAHGWCPAQGYPYAGGMAGPGPGQEQPGKEPPTNDAAWQPPTLPDLGIDVVEALADLVAQNLVRSAPRVGSDARFTLLETIQEYGREQLDAWGEMAAVQHAHAAAMVAFAEAAGLGLWGPERRTWAARLEADASNLRAALTWLATQPAPATQLMLRLAEALWPFWQTRGRASEGREWLEAALVRPGGTAATRAAALTVVGYLAWVQGDDQRATEAFAQSLPQCQALDYHAGIGRAQFGLALIAWRHCALDRMTALAEAALTHFQLGNDPVGQTVCTLALAIAARERGAAERAQALLRQAADLAEAVGFGWGLATARYYAGELARERGDLPAAVPSLAAGLRAYHAAGDPVGMGGCIAGLALVAAAQGHDEQAARLLGAAARLCTEVGALLPPTEQARYQAATETVRARLGGTRFAQAFAGGQALPAGEAVAEALRVADAAVHAHPPAEVALTPRQCEIVRLRARGYVVKEIAVLLKLSRSTVYHEQERALDRLGLQTIAELVTYAVRQGLI